MTIIIYNLYYFDLGLSDIPTGKFVFDIVWQFNGIVYNFHEVLLVWDVCWWDCLPLALMDRKRKYRIVDTGFYSS